MSVGVSADQRYDGLIALPFSTKHIDNVSPLL
jgi:hypothetical protein